MTAASSLTRNVSTPMLWTLRGRYADDELLRSAMGDYGFAQVSKNLVKLIDDELTARGEMPRGQNGERE